MQIVKTLDQDHTSQEKFKKIHLALSCRGGLLSVDYFLRVELNFDSVLSSDEKLRMPLDFYALMILINKKIKI